jgi:hypothetical protein
VNIGGTSYRIRPWPEPRTKWSVTFSKLSTGYHQGRDRGASEDVYEGTVLVSDTVAHLDSLQAVLAANRNGITLSSMSSGEMVFGANVDYSGSISATVVNHGMRRNVFHTGADALEITFRALSPALLGITSSWASLRLQEGWEGDRSHENQKHFSYGQTASYLDHETDAGLFSAKFVQTTEQMMAIRAYLLTTARGNPVQFPSLLPTLYPFGANGSEAAYQMCHVVAWEDRRINLNRWELNLTLAQADPYFSAGSDAGDTLFDHLTAGTSGEPDTYGTPGG